MEIVEKDILKLFEKQDVVVAIDGMSGSMKTSYAQYLASKYHGRIIHMDDYYLPHNLQTEKWGGNIDFERFKEEVLSHLGEDIVMKKYNCHTASYSKEIILKKTKLTIIEGAYSLMPLLGKYFDLGYVFIVDEKAQIERLLKREGIEKTKIFIKKWIRLENAYLINFDLKNIYPTVNLKNIQGENK